MTASVVKISTGLKLTNAVSSCKTLLKSYTPTRSLPNIKPHEKPLNPYSCAVSAPLSAEMYGG